MGEKCPHCGQNMPKPVDTPKLGLQSILWFGKYRDQPIENVLGMNPQYLIWAEGNVENFNLDDEVLDKATRRAEAERQARHIDKYPKYSSGRYPHWDYDDPDDGIPF